MFIFSCFHFFNCSQFQNVKLQNNTTKLKISNFQIKHEMTISKSLNNKKQTSIEKNNNTTHTTQQHKNKTYTHKYVVFCLINFSKFPNFTTSTIQIFKISTFQTFKISFSSQSFICSKTYTTS